MGGEWLQQSLGTALTSGEASRRASASCPGLACVWLLLGVLCALRGSERPREDHGRAEGPELLHHTRRLRAGLSVWTAATSTTTLGVSHRPRSSGTTEQITTLRRASPGSPCLQPLGRILPVYLWSKRLDVLLLSTRPPGALRGVVFLIPSV